MWGIESYNAKEFLVFNNKIKNSLNSVLVFYRPLTNKAKIFKPLKGVLKIL